MSALPWTLLAVFCAVWALAWLDWGAAWRVCARWNFDARWTLSRALVKLAAEILVAGTRVAPREALVELAMIEPPPAPRAPRRAKWRACGCGSPGCAHAIVTCACGARWRAMAGQPVLCHCGVDLGPVPDPWTLSQRGSHRHSER